MTEPATDVIWTCKACSNKFKGKYCNRCGEKVITAHDKSLLHIAEEGFHFITHFEGKFFTSVKAIFKSPGKFSADYCYGIQKKYFKPISFFLMLVIIYLLFPLVDGLNLSLKYHTTTQWYGEFAQATTQRVTEKYGFTADEVAQKFSAASQTVSKVLLLLVIPVLAGWSMLLTYKRKNSLYYDHFIFSTEISSVLVLWGFLILPLLVMLFLYIQEWITGASRYNDGVVSLILLASLLVYVFMAAKRFFQFRWAQAALYTIAYISFYILFMMFVYRFLLFWVSINRVH